MESSFLLQNPVTIIGFILLVLLAIILTARLLGAWMLRINEIINLQEKILSELKDINSKK